MEKKMKEIENQFKEHRFTPQRRLVLEIFLENRDRHLSAEEVFNFSRERGEEIGLATIYRTLELLEDMGLIHKLNFGDGRSRFELVRLDISEEQHHHHHLVCLGCDDIFEVEDDLLYQLEEVIEQKHGFDILDHNLQFYGYCSDCQKEGKRSDSKKKSRE